MTGRGGAGTGSWSGDAEAPLEETRAWLAPRLEDVPEVLARSVDELLERAADPEGRPAGVHAPNGSVPDYLAFAAIFGLDRVARAEGRGRDRELASRLLAADACLTWAFEAAADAGSAEELEALAEANGLRGRIGDLLERLEGEE